MDLKHLDTILVIDKSSAIEVPVPQDTPEPVEPTDPTEATEPAENDQETEGTE